MSNSATVTTPAPASQGIGEYRLVSALFLRLLALIYLVAFASIGLQIAGLAGPGGILPFGEQLEFVRAQYGARGYWLLPTLFWLDASDLALQAVAVAGCVLSLVLLAGRLVRTSLILLFVCYLSLMHAGQLFMNFQWDYLLLEAGFLAIFLPGGSRLVIWLFRWLLFRFRFLSGASKLVSGDPTWAGFTALHYYFETQPLPHGLSWYAHQLPDWVLAAGVGLVFFAELVVPFMMLLPRRFRLFAAVTTIGMQLLILFTSNHNFFNLLTIVLCLFLLDDRAVSRFLPHRWGARLIASVPSKAPRSKWSQLPLGVLGSLILAVSLIQGWELLTRSRVSGPLASVVEQINAFHIVNKYHVFPVIDTERLELLIEGSRDGRSWQAYDFRYKPGDPQRRPPFVVPHQPRLDWMLWFVPDRHPLNLMWFERFIDRLLENAPAVTALLEHNPFAEEPPRYIRVELYRYRFTTPEERAATGAWWVREDVGPFYPLHWFQRAETSGG